MLQMVPKTCRRPVSARLPAVAVFLLLVGQSTAAPVAPADSARALAWLKGYLAEPAASRAPLANQPSAGAPLTQKDAQAAQQLLWDQHVTEFRAARKDEIDQRILREGKLAMPFFYETFGEKPAGGRSLFISMHGGGGAPKALNDQQYENQKHLYRPAEGIYLAPRAPTNTWNLWHEAHIDRLFDRLIQDLIVLEDVNPNRVYILGYSAGGDGVYQLAPRMADRLAAASMMAGHPNDASPLGLRNIGFAIHVGALDDGFKRNEVARQWAGKLDLLQKDDPDGYVHVVKLHEGRAHWMNLEDAEALPWMAKFTRNPQPKRIVWMQSGITHRRFYWLAVEAAHEKSGNEVVASLAGQKITLHKCDPDQLLVRLNDRMLDLDKPVVVECEAKEIFNGMVARTIGTLSRTLDEDGDPEAVYSAELRLIVRSTTKTK